MKIWVQPGGADRRVPKETSTAVKPAWFKDGVPTQVEDTSYIQRRLKDKDLVQVPAPAAPAAEAPAVAEQPAPAPAASETQQKLADAVAASAARATADKKAG